MNSTIQQSSFDFLKLLSQNNNRDWFNEHKNNYLLELQKIQLFLDELLGLMNNHDVIETPSGKSALHRIYKDSRFSKEKTPYKTNWSASFRRASKERRGGYYLHLEPGNTFIAGGFWGPNTDDLKRIRQDIDYNYDEWQELFSDQLIKDFFGGLVGSQLATAPKGFSKEHPGIDFLRYKQFILKHHFSDQEVLSSNFIKDVNRAFIQLRPFFDHMSEILTTDANGISVV